MPRLLVINPNTSQRVSRSIDAMVRDEAGERTQIQTVTASFGFRYISSRTAVAIAAHAVLDAAAKAIAAGITPDAIVLGCFGDPGRDALAEMTGLPVIGFAEAGLLTAAANSGSFLVATRGAIWCEMLAELVVKLGLRDRVTGIYSIENPNEDATGIAQILSEQARVTGAARVVLGGAGMIPSLPAIISAATVPVLDSHRAGVRKAVRLASARTANPVQDARGETSGLSLELSNALAPDITPPLQAENAH